MEVIFGVQATDRALRVELDEEQVDGLRKRLDGAFADGSTGQVLWITEKSGRTVGIPVDKLAYVELGADKAGRRVGFSAKTV